MLEALFKRMAVGMLWIIVVPTALLILMLSFLIGAFTIVVWNSDEITYEGAIGTISARATKLEIKVNEAISFNHQLTEAHSKLEESLVELRQANTNISSLPSKQISNQERTIIKNQFNDISNTLNLQSNLLMNQQEKLEAVNQEVIQFKQDLKKFPQKK